jgi:hypothetical protein
MGAARSIQFQSKVLFTNNSNAFLLFSSLPPQMACNQIAFVLRSSPVLGLRMSRVIAPLCCRGIQTSEIKRDLTPQLPKPRITSFDKPILPDLSEEQKKVSYF